MELTFIELDHKSVNKEVKEVSPPPPWRDRRCMLQGKYLPMLARKFIVMGN